MDTFYHLPLKDRRLVAEETMALWFDLAGDRYPFQPGQNADFTIEQPPYTDDEGNTRTFSLAASPHHRNTIMIATRLRSTAFKRSLREIPIGTRLKVTPATGELTLHEDSAIPAVFLAGGIGVTPFRSIIEWATHVKLAHRLYFFYSNRTPAAAAFLEDFEKWAKENPKLTFIPTITDSDIPSWKYERGRIDAQLLKKYLPDLNAPIFYTAGPQAMVTAMRALLIELNVPPARIKTEQFTGY